MILKAACKELGIPYGEKTPGGFILHDMRHTFVTILEQGLIDSSTTRSFSGHSRDRMLKRYAHATTDSRAKAMSVIKREVGLNGNGNAGEAELQKIFKAIRAKKMTFDEFKERVSSILTIL